MRSHPARAHGVVVSGDARPRPHLGRLAVWLLGLTATALLATGLEGPGVAPQTDNARRVATGAGSGASSADIAPLFDVRPALGARAPTAWAGQPLAASLQSAQPRRGERFAAMPVAVPTTAVPPAAPPASSQAPLASPATVPLPAPRPAELAAAATPVPAARSAERRLSRRARVAAASPARVEDTRNFFEKLFGLEPAPKPALAYASLDAAPLPAAPKPRLAPVPDQQASAGVAVYDISARTVILPNGERLEAHSGLRDKLDDPRFVHMRMVGATPPGTYELTEREALFHGVRAIRLNPVGGAGAIFGRAGLLAHTFMLGPNGDSNGCVSFRDYNRFLQAFLSGEVRRLVVVTGRGYDGVPAGRSLFGMAERDGRGA